MPRLSYQKPSRTYTGAGKDLHRVLETKNCVLTIPR